MTTATRSEVLRDLMECAPIGLAFVDSDLRYVVANESIASESDMAAEAHVGKKVAEVVPELWPTLEPIFTRVLLGETIINVDLGSASAAPPRRRWLSSFYPVRKNGEIIGIEVMADDVTDLRDTESALASRNDLYTMLAHSSQAMSSSTTREELLEKVCEIAVDEGLFKFAWAGTVEDGMIHAVTRAGEDNGFFHELEEKGTTESLDPSFPWSQGPTGQAFITGRTAVFNRIASEPSSPQWQEAVDRLQLGSGASFPIREGGEVTAVLSLYSDEPDYFEDGLLETMNEIIPLLSSAMDRFALVSQGEVDESDLLMRDRALRAATQGAVLVDARLPGQPIIYATPAFEHLTGYPPAETIGRNPHFLQGAETDPDTVDTIRAALAAGEECSVEILNYRKNGEAFWNDLTITPLYSQEGELTHFIGVQTDATERHTLELQVRQAQKMEAVGQLAGGVAHDFNNLLTVIRGEATLALSDATSASSQEHLKQVDRAAQHAADLTHQLLAFSRQLVLKPEPTDLNSVVSKTVALVARLIGENIELREDLGSELDAVLVDPGQLQQVIINLAINARDAMPNGGTICFRTALGAADEEFPEEPTAYVKLEISDDGIGMDEQTRLKVFDPFFTTKDEGTGLGLATVYGIVNQSGGQIAIDSEKDRGTTFTVYLPLTFEPVAVNQKARRQIGTLDGDETILHVEDSDMIRPLISRMLGRHGYEILSAANAQEAQEIAASHQGEIDLLLTDIVMPGLNGRELAETLYEDNPELTVLFTSGYPADTLLRQGIAESEVNFIQKPFVAADLVPLVRSLLDESAKAA